MPSWRAILFSTRTCGIQLTDLKMKVARDLKKKFHTKLLTPCNRVFFFENLTVSHLVKRSPLVVWFITLFTTSANSHCPDTGIYFSNIYFIIIIPSVLRSYERPLTFWLFKHNPCPTFVFFMHKIRQAPLIILNVTTQNNAWRGIQECCSCLKTTSESLLNKCVDYKFWTAQSSNLLYGR